MQALVLAMKQYIQNIPEFLFTVYIRNVIIGHIWHIVNKGRQSPVNSVHAMKLDLRIWES